MIQNFNAVNYHSDHKTWKSEIDLYLDEIGIFEDTLGEVLQSNSKVETRSNVEAFQNKFLVHRKALDVIGNSITKHEMTLLNAAKASHDQSSSHDLEYHAGINSKLETERKIFKDLKSSFHDFLASVL